MKPIKSLFILAILVLPGLASAQGYYGGGPVYGPPPIPGGFHARGGRLTFGGSIGLGYMNDGGTSVQCSGCDYNPATFEIDGHIGGMINYRMAILLELQANLQQVALDAANDTTLEQTLVLGAVQYWLTPQLWLKGGVGLANLQLNDNVNGVTYVSPGNGLGLLAGLGFELLSARFFAIDLQARLTGGFYGGNNASFGDGRITSGTIGVGINWY
jgi:hypothetical protein